APVVARELHGWPRARAHADQAFQVLGVGRRRLGGERGDERQDGGETHGTRASMTRPRPRWNGPPRAALTSPAAPAHRRAGAAAAPPAVRLPCRRTAARRRRTPRSARSPA